MGRVKELGQKLIDLDLLLKMEKEIKLSEEQQMFIKGSIDEFLLEGGTALGYDEYNLPKLDDMSSVLEHNIPVWEYYGWATEKEYDPYRNKENE